MPVYEYICKDCQKEFSQVLTVKEHDTKKIQCPKCKSEKVEKVIELVTVIGSKKSRGW
jgi:putative FmdB family regulatory protein